MRFSRLYPVPLYLIAAALSLLPVLAAPGQVLLWRGGAYSDLLISHWPNAHFVRQAIAEWGQLPLWNPTILSGAPLAADPLAGIWYLPTWLAIALPPGIGFNLLIWLHLAWGGIGCWRLARELGLSHAGAVVCGLAFSATPKLLGHVGLGHVGLLFAVSWTPWAALAAARAAAALEPAGGATSANGTNSRARTEAPPSAGREQFGDRPAARAALAGAVAGVAFLADPRWFFFLALLTVAIFLWRAAHSHLTQRLAMLALGGSVSLAVASVLLLPLAEFVRLTTRAGLPPSEGAALSLPWPRLIGLVAPELGGWPEWQPYAGAVVLFLAVLAMVEFNPAARFWLGVAAFGLLFALGDAAPVYPLLRAVVPGLAQLRVPPRSLLLTAFGLSMLAGLGVDSLEEMARRRVGRLALGLFALYLGSAAVHWLTLAHQPPQERLIRTIPWITSGVFVGIVGGWTASVFRNRLSHGAFALFLCAVLVMDLTLVNLTTLRADPVATDPAVRLAADLLGPHERALSPSYSLSQPSAAVSGVQLADGVNPLQLAHYYDFMQAATGFREVGYSVTLPPFPSGAVAKPWGFAPDLERLGLLAVSTIVSAYPLDDTGLEAVETAGGQRLYRNPAVRPRAWIETGGGLVPADLLSWTPNRIEVRSSEAGRLVLSEIDYPGWVATVDGVPAQIHRYADLLRSVEVPAGMHTIVFSFRSAVLVAGAALTVIGSLVTLSLWLRGGAATARTRGA